MIDLQEYTNRGSSSSFIQWVPSYSPHGVLARKHIKRILENSPEYYGFAKAVAEYPVIKWGKISRERIALDPERIVSDYFGIEGKEFAEKQKENLLFCNMVIEFVEKAINQSGYRTLLWSVHSYEAEGASTYMINTHYRSAFEDLCKDNHREFLDLINDRGIEKPEDDDILFVYRKADLLLRLRSVLEESDNMTFQDTIICIDRCISCFDTYYLKDPIFRKVALLYSLGFKETRIAELSGKSRSCIRNMKNEAARAISYIIWGFID